MDDLSKSYLTLGLKPGASLEEAKQAYRDLVKVWHPDRFGHDERLRLMAQEKLKEINGAYEVLQAYFFDLESSPAADASGAATSATEAAVPAAGSHRRTLFWAALGLGVLGLIGAGIFLVLPRPARDSGPGPTHDQAAAGVVRRSLSFAADHSYLKITTTGSLAGTFTVECWALSRQPKDTGTIVSSRGPRDFSFNLKFRQGKRFHRDIGDGSIWLAKMANASFKYNRGIWYHVAYVVTPTNYAVYVDGEPWGEHAIYPPGAPLLYDAEHQLWFGADAIDSDFLAGCVAELRIWTTARTRDQIKAHLNQPLTGTEPGLQGYWQLSEGSGVDVADRSGHGFTGKLIGSTFWSTNTPSTWQ